ncbi:STM4014 family protein [Deinococcus roseus]|uniref:ATP-grasp domain-containing protein n=1 Tax=Deinococcus roseus TaxID=392414 RepID=A0ABQ2CZ82_9DEIO|nr:STM4014 family protein [Deinococcus roseus]GGJ24253.1 hypothetical protein GCM10008938_08010 [Deinococcus roseus]
MLLPSRPVVVVAPPASRRVKAFQASLQELGWPAARVVSPLEVIQKKVDLAAVVPQGSVVRIDASGECLQTERALLKLGQEGLDSTDAETLDLERGEILPSGQWYLGLQRYFALLQTQLQQAPHHQCTIDFQEALQLFDKRITSRRWQQAGLPVPPFLSEPHDFEDLLEHMKASGLSRVFVKLAHGSSASGAVALHISGQVSGKTVESRLRVISTVEMENGRLYNSRKLRHYDQWADIQTLINLLCRHPLQVEAWVPKATFQGKPMDLRVVVIGQTPMQAMVRLGQGPMTNLHLGNERGDVQALQDRMGSHWSELEATCQKAMQVFPKSLYAGLDVLLRSDFRRHCLLEGNAFGDYHRNVFWQGMDTFTAQLFKLQERQPC